MGALKSKCQRSKSSSRKNKGDKSGEKKKEKRVVNLPDSQSSRRTVDPRLPFSNYRQLFSIRNAWKAISRQLEDNAKETLIRLFHKFPKYKQQFPSIKDMTDEEDIRKDEDFETSAVDIYQIFDDVIEALENVDKALKEIQYAAANTVLTKRMTTDMEDPFIETLRVCLGSERFTETTENNYKLLYQFVMGELWQYLDDDTDDLDTEDGTIENNNEGKVMDSDAIVGNNTADTTDVDIEITLCDDNDT